MVVWLGGAVSQLPTPADALHCARLLYCMTLDYVIVLSSCGILKLNIHKESRQMFEFESFVTTSSSFEVHLSQQPKMYWVAVQVCVHVCVCVCVLCVHVCLLCVHVCLLCVLCVHVLCVCVCACVVCVCVRVVCACGVCVCVCMCCVCVCVLCVHVLCACMHV